MPIRKLSVRLSPGFSAELWSWSVVITEAASGKVEIAWQTSSFRAEPVHERQRVRAMPAWCEDVWRLVDAIEFGCLPPNARWASWLDDAEVFTLERQEQDSTASLSICYASQAWPALPEATRAALLQLVATLDARARSLHGAEPA